MKNIILAVLLFTFSTLARSAHITVGTDTCHYTSIQAAINATGLDPNTDEIRVAKNGTYNENIIITDQSLIMRGGYADCASAVDENPASRSGTTIITGVVNADLPVIRITGDSSFHKIVFDSLRINGGTTSLGNYSAGGISAFESWSEIDIINSEISGNTGAAGGGIAAIQGSGYTRIKVIDSLVIGNNASIGGGILCSGDSSGIVMDGLSGVSSNNATVGQGGGVYLADGCDFTSYSGTVGGGFDFRGIAFNSAAGKGGGIYAKEAAQVTLYGHENCSFSPCAGDNISPANLTSNDSGSDGGGAYITGINTSLKIYAGLVADNTAEGDGGAIYVNNAASFLTERLSSECWNQDHCNYYSNNQAGVSNGKGGMVYSQLGTVDINHSVIEGNRADIGTVIAAINSPAISTIKSSIIHNNGDNGADGFNDIYAFSIASGAKIDVSHSTIADNSTLLAVFNISPASVGDSDLFASIVDANINTPVFASNQSNNVYLYCMMLHESDSIPNSQLFSTVDDAEFINRANGNYHLNPLSSPAIDYCDDPNASNPSDYKDIDFESYGVNYPAIGTELFDLGADEVYPKNTLTVSVTGNGTITSSPLGIDCGIDCSEDYLDGTQVTLTAVPNILNNFDGWTGACTGSSTTCIITMDQAKNTTAIFTPSYYHLLVTITGNGRVTSNPTGIDCPGDCMQSYTPSSSVTLSATPDSGYVFVEWTGSCSGSGICALTMDAGKNVRALFVPEPTYTLSTTVSGNGTITSNPAGINCGVDCSEDFTNNTTVTLTASPTAGFNFVNWSGDCTGSGSCVVSMTQDSNVRANFTANEYTLTTAVVGNGSIVSNPAGINCGGDCSQVYTNNTSVTLSATPMAGFSFTGWTGDCTGTGSCVVSMTQDRNVTATFSTIEYTLTTVVVGSGSITSNPAGINCGGDCSQVYTNNTSVTLSATPMAGFSFTGWTGDCTGTGSCVVSMTQDRNVTATFTTIEYTLTTVVVGSGSITSNPAGINCGGDCSQVYTNNTSVTLSATPMAGSSFTGWTGDCTGTGSCVVSMTQDRNVTATFSAADDFIFSSSFED